MEVSNQPASNLPHKILSKFTKLPYIKPLCYEIQLSNDIMENLPLGGSNDYTDSGDDSGGGLAKKRMNYDKEDDKKYWLDDSPGFK